MTRLITYILLSLAITLGITWLLAVPGTLQIDLAGYRMQPPIGVSAILLIATILLSIFIWSLIRRLVAAPKFLQRIASRRRKDHGVEALSNSVIALQAGDAQKARQLAREARIKLPHNAAAQLLEARAELALGQWGQAREQYRLLIDNPKTTLAALSGLYEQAKAQKRDDAALTFAQKAYSISPQLDWASNAIFEQYNNQADWLASLKIVNEEPGRTKEEKQNKKRRLAVLHTAIAKDSEASNPTEALDNARIALKLLPDFVPAALIAARLYSNKGELRKASSLLRRVWRATRHPHIALLFANAQPGISPTERLKRITDLISLPPAEQSSAIIVAQIAIEAKSWATARDALSGYVKDSPTRAVCVAMAKIEEGQNADQGRARQWLARAISATPDPVWVADGVITLEWAPISPITGKLDRFEFKVPTSALGNDETEFEQLQPMQTDQSEIDLSKNPVSDNDEKPVLEQEKLPEKINSDS